MNNITPRKRPYSYRSRRIGESSVVNEDRVGAADHADVDFAQSDDVFDTARTQSFRSLVIGSQADAVNQGNHQCVHFGRGLGLSVSTAVRTSAGNQVIVNDHVDEGCAQLDDRSDGYRAMDNQVSSNQGNAISNGNDQCRQAGLHAGPSGTRAPRRRACPISVPRGSVTEPIPSRAMVLAEPTMCGYCGAKKFQYETSYFCCANGEVKVAINPPPVGLRDLCYGQDEESRNFRQYGRLYNNFFAFSSLGGHIECQNSKHIYVFKLHGQIYHFLPSLISADNRPKYMQLYFYDAEHEYEIRSGLFTELRPTVIQRLMTVMANNPYAQFFKSLRHINIDLETTIQISKNPQLDPRVYNAPSSSEVAGVLLDSTASNESNGPYIVVSGRDNRSHRIMHYYGCYDPLQYPLPFPLGESGWYPGLKRLKRNSNSTDVSHAFSVLSAQSVEDLFLAEDEAAANAKGRCISCREYYCFLFQIREDNFLLDMERILQQFYVDMYVKVENTRLDFFRNNQSTIRADLYQGIIDSADAGENNASNIGHRVILPSSFIGGPRDMRCRYLNAMALVRRYGKPDLFITLTCNPNWPEIKNELRPGQRSQNRPDLVARIFRAKLVHLKKELVEKKRFGEVAAYIYVVEFQKRGLPHAHFLVILKPEFKMRCPEDFDRFVTAEIPPSTEPHLRKVVLTHMMHGPCGALNPHCACMKEQGGSRRCRIRYPKEFSDFTTTNSDGYPTYRRRNTGESVLVRKSYLDNRWVIPYNPYLLALFDSHINVEVCSTVNAVKYLYKYVYKGHDRVAFNVAEDGGVEMHDEIERFQTGRWISPPEAAWRTAGFPLYEMHPPVMPLQVHLANMPNVSFNERESVSSIASNEVRTRTPLTEFFKLNARTTEGQKYLYQEVPEYFTWDVRRKVWKPRRSKRFQVGRLTFVSPSESERFHLRLLLTEVRGPTSFEALRTVDGIVHSSFRAAAEALCLIEREDLVDRCMDEAISVQMPGALRRLFVTVLIFCHPSDPRELWDKYYTHLSEDYRHAFPNSETQALSHTCRSIAQILESMGKKLDDFGLGGLCEEEPDDIRLIRDIQDVLEAPVPQEFIDARKQLNQGQRIAYKAIMKSVKEERPGLFFVDGPGGTGKTFLYNALYARVRSLGKIVLPTASSGIAASNLPCGRTAHSRFKLPIDHETSLTCNVPKQGALAALLVETSLIIWDEAPMANKASVHALDLLLRDLGDSTLPFGGKIVVLGGDFRQVLPVVPHKSQHEAVEASLVSSSLWPQFTRFHLVENMRAREDPTFASFLLKLGDGRLQQAEVSTVNLPAEIVVPCSDDDACMNALVDIIFPEIHSETLNPEVFINKAILAPRNDDVDMINSSFIEHFDGTTVTYKSFDRLLDDNCNIYPVEFLHTLAPAGMSPHELVLKEDCPVMLLRNMDPSGGLCNGTRMICKRFFPNLIVCEIATGSYKGQQAMIPRVKLRPPSSLKLPFQFQRTQFPIKLSFAMTINKSQGQTLNDVGIYLRQPCFSHGQLYVALSRARCSSKVKVISYVSNSNESSTSVRNVVSYEVLRRACIME